MSRTAVRDITFCISSIFTRSGRTIKVPEFLEAMAPLDVSSSMAYTFNHPLHSLCLQPTRQLALHDRPITLRPYLQLPLTNTKDSELWGKSLGYHLLPRPLDYHICQHWQLDSCDSPEDVSSVLRTQAQAFAKFRRDDKKSTWLDNWVRY